MCLARVLQVLYCYQDEIRIKAEAARKGKGTPNPALDDTRTNNLKTGQSGGGVGSGKSSGNNAVGVSAGDVKALFFDEGEGIEPPTGFSGAEWVKATGAVKDLQGQREAGSAFTPSRLGAAASGDTGMMRRSSDQGGKIGGSPFLAGGRKAAALQVRTFAFGSDSDSQGGSRDRYARVAAPHVTAFLRAALLALPVCFHDRLPVAEDDGMYDDEGPGGEGMAGANGPPPLPSADDAFEPLCRFFGFPVSAEEMMSQPGLIEASRRYGAVFVEVGKTGTGIHVSSPPPFHLPYLFSGNLVPVLVESGGGDLENEAVGRVYVAAYFAYSELSKHPTGSACGSFSFNTLPDLGGKH